MEVYDTARKVEVMVGNVLVHVDDDGGDEGVDEDGESDGWMVSMVYIYKNI